MSEFSEEQETNINNLFEDLFMVCHKSNVPKTHIMTRQDEINLRNCYIKYMKSYGFVTDVSLFYEDNRAKENSFSNKK